MKRQLLPSIRGFTLVEALLTVLIGAMIVITALAAYNSTVLTSRKMLDESHRWAQLRYALGQIQNDLANFSRSPYPRQMLLQGRKQISAQSPGDRIIFNMVSDSPAEIIEKKTAVFEIEYALYEDRDEKTLFLGRRAAPAGPQNPEKPKGLLTQLAPDLQAFHLEYFDGTAWLDSWQEQNRFPRLIHITLVASGLDAKKTPIRLSRIVSLEPLPAPSPAAISSGLSAPTSYERPPVE